MADEHDFMHKYDLAFLWGYYSTTAVDSQLVNEMSKPPTIRSAAPLFYSVSRYMPLELGAMRPLSSAKATPASMAAVTLPPRRV